MENRKGKQPGSCLLHSEEIIVRNLVDKALQQAIIGEAKLALKTGKSVIFSHEDYTAFIEVIRPPMQLMIAGGGNDVMPLIAGGGNDVMPLVEIATIVGWPVTVANGHQ